MIGVLGTDERGVTRWRDETMAEYPCYTADDTQLKELARGTMALVLLHDGVVRSKIAFGALNPNAVESPSSVDEFMTEIQEDGHRWFVLLNLCFGGALLVLYLCQGIILAIRAKIRQIYRKKHVKNS